MISTILIVCFLAASGFFLGYTDSSVYWGVIPMVIGTYLGCWHSQFGRALASKSIEPALREKLLQTIRTLAFMWLFISVCFVIIGFLSASLIK